jgi:hypothetical protein
MEYPLKMLVNNLYMQVQTGCDINGLSLWLYRDSYISLTLFRTMLFFGKIAGFSTTLPQPCRII